MLTGFEGIRNPFVKHKKNLKHDILCLLLFLLRNHTLVRVQDRLMYFMKAIGAFSTDTVRGLIYMYARGFITITRVSHPLHYILLEVPQQKIANTQTIE